MLHLRHIDNGETQDTSAYHSWAGFKIQVQAALSQWLPKAGYAAGLLLRSLRDKAQQWWYFLNHPEVPIIIARNAPCA